MRSFFGPLYQRIVKQFFFAPGNYFSDSYFAPVRAILQELQGPDPIDSPPDGVARSD
jgi:hypothetical protein